MGRQLFVIDGETNELLKTMRLPHWPYSLIYNPIVNKVYCGIYENILVFDCRTDSLIKIIPFADFYPDDMVLNTNHNKLYVMRTDIIITPSYVIDCYKDSIIKTIPEVWIGAYDARSDRVYGENCGGRLTILDGKSDSVVKVVNERVATWTWTLNTRNNKYYCRAGEYPSAVKIFNAENDSLLRVVWPGVGLIYNLAYNPRNNKIYVGGEEDWEGYLTIPIIDGETNTVDDYRYLLGRHGQVIVYYNSINNKLYCGGESNLWVIDFVGEPMIREFEMPRWYGWTWNKKNNRFYISASNSSIYVFRDEIPGVEEVSPSLRIKEFEVSPTIGNSFNISWRGKEKEKVIIYNPLGRKVCTMELNPGKNLIWEGKDERNDKLPSGIYFLKLERDRITEKIILK